MHILNVFGGRTNTLYIDSMNLYRSLCIFPGNPLNGVGSLWNRCYQFCTLFDTPADVLFTTLVRAHDSRYTLRLLKRGLLL